jgi:hypothetical protein
MSKVLKPFNTRLQRFKAGDDVPDDADLSPHTAEGLVGRFIEAPPTPKAGRAKQPEPVEAETVRAAD